MPPAEGVAMGEAERICAAMLGALARSGAAYQVYHHRPVLTYADAAAVRDELGFTGTEGKAVACHSTVGLAVAVTVQGRRLDLRAVRALLGGGKARIATAEEVRGRFGTEPGSVAPFGYAAEVPVLIDPAVYREAWLLYSAAVPTATVRVCGPDLRLVRAALPNAVYDLPSA